MRLSALSGGPFKPLVTIQPYLVLALAFALLLMSAHEQRAESSFEALCRGDGGLLGAVRRERIVVERQ